MRCSTLLLLLLVLPSPVAGQWSKLNSGTTATLRGVSAPGLGVCWASGSKGTVLLSTDGGAHWSTRPVPNGENLDFRDIEAFDESTAVIMAAGLAQEGLARIFKTTDGGAHWKLTFATDRKGIFLDSMAFWDASRGIMLSDPVDGKFVIFVTGDGGDSWQELKPQSLPPALPNEGAFAASGTAIAVADKDSVWFGTGGAEAARVFRSSDAGQHWDAVPVPIKASKATAGVFGLAFADAKLGVAVGGDYTMRDGELTAIAVTQDGGKTWMAEKNPLPPLQGVAVVAAPVDSRHTAYMADFYAVGNAEVTATLTDSTNPSDTPPKTDSWHKDPGITGNAVAVVRDGRFTSVYIVGPQGSILLNRTGPDR